jgi:anaerobic magnesium-protoporphyrin IX monomethyl ester cyclase
MVDLISLRFGRLRGGMPPVGPLSIVAALNSAGIQCRLTDAQLDPSMNPFAVDRLASWILESAADVIAFSVFNDAIPLVVATLDLLGAKLKDRRVFLGGPGVVGIARQLLERVPSIESVIVGEGETAFPLAITKPGQAALLSGVFSRTPMGQVIGFGRTVREDLDSLAPINWQLSLSKSYTVVPWSTMRGCPFGCEFCEIIAFMGRRVTKRKVANAIDDLERAMTSLGTTTVAVLDDTFTIDKKRVLDLCNEIQRRRIKISFEIFSRADTINLEMMKALSDSGCSRVFFGLDGGDEAVLDSVGKNLRIEEAEQVVFMAAEFFEVTTSFIWGYPFESFVAFGKMLALAERFRACATRHRIWPQIHLLSPSAGTPLFEKFGDRMVLDENVETLPAAGRLSMQSFRPNYDNVLRLIAEDRVLAAPFYRYATPAFEEKLAAVMDLNKSLDREVGTLILRKLARMEDTCNK